MAYQRCTFSLDPTIIKKLEDLTAWLRTGNKSKVLAQLVEREHTNQKLLREEVLSNQ